MDASAADEVLRASFQRYQAASAAVRGLPDGSTAELVAHDELRSARLGLCEALEATGWEPPDDVRAQVELDARDLARHSPADRAAV